MSSKPVIRVKLELWDSAENYVKHGMNTVSKALWKATSPDVYRRVQSLIKEKNFFARGFYDGVSGKIVICLDDIAKSYTAAVARLDDEERRETNDEFSFGLQFYYTLLHEMLHSTRVEARDSNDGHSLNLDKYEKLHPWLKRLFDGLLSLQDSGDAFRRHPENRREP